MKVAVIGEGAWGTAVALLLADNGYQVNLWCQDPAVAQSIEKRRINERYFPEFIIPKAIVPVVDMASALEGVTYIFEAIPIKYMRSVFAAMRPHMRKEHVVVILSKGIENDTLFLPTELVSSIVDFPIKQAVLAGPSFAQEIAERRTTAVALASSCDVALKIQPMLANTYFRPYITTDIIGVQVGAALKNVMSLGVGIADGAGCSENTKAFLLTRGLAEIAQLAVSLGAKQETVYGLSGLGDLILSSMGTHGRNVALGRQLGQGKTIAELEQIVDVMPESINTLTSLEQLIQRRKLDLPVCRGIYQVVYGNKKIGDVLAELMARPLEYECEIY